MCLGWIGDFHLTARNLGVGRYYTRIIWSVSIQHMLISLTAFCCKMWSDCVKQNCPRQRAEPRRHFIDKVTCAAAEGCKLFNPCSLSVTSASTACFWHGSKKFGETGLPYWGSSTHSKDWAVCICPTSQDIACLNSVLLISWVLRSEVWDSP